MTNKVEHCERNKCSEENEHKQPVGLWRRQQ